MISFQAKQKKNNRRVKEKERDEKSEVKILERLRDEIAVDNSDGLPAKVEVTANVDALEEGSSDGSDMPNRLVKSFFKRLCSVSCEIGIFFNWNYVQRKRSAEQGRKHC